MTINRYFTLMTSDASGSPPSGTLIKRFKVVEGGYKPFLEKAITESRTVEGERDIAQGGIYKTYNFVIKVYETDPSGDQDWGTLEDIQQFYQYNNPNGTPSDVLTMIDHYGNSLYVSFAGQLPLEPATVMLEGINAVYFIPITLINMGAFS